MALNQFASCSRVVVTRVEEYPEDRRVPATPLRMLRALNGLSASQLARLADVDRSTIRRLEAGIGEPQRRTARKIAAVLSCPVALLFPVKDEDPAGQQGLATTSADVGDGYVYAER